MEIIKQNSKEAIKAAREIFKMNQLEVNQRDGIVRTREGVIVGSQKWVVNVDYSLEQSGEDFIINAVSKEAAIARVEEIVEGKARRARLEPSAVFINYATPAEDL
jgi:hypothetical protein